MKRYLTNINILAFVVSVLTYFVFFSKLLDPNLFLDGSDAFKFFYPSRYYLYETLSSGKFPFWTERIFSGYAIYADSERGFLNPLNIIFTYFFGPFNSYKVLHFLIYLLGSISLFLFFKNKGLKLSGFFVGNLIYFFSFFHLYHQQHFTFIFSTYLLPLGILLFDYYINYKKLRFLFFYSSLISLLMYFGSFQSTFIVFLGSFLYLIFCSGIGIRKLFLTFLVCSYLIVTLSLPLLLPTLQLYFHSYRHATGVSYKEGSFIPLMFVNVLYPYFFGNNENYKWLQVSDQFLVHETYIYVGIVSFIMAILGIYKVTNLKLKNFFVFLILVFFILGFIAYVPNIKLPILSLFRYWGRTILLVDFAFAFFAANFISSLELSIGDVFKDFHTRFLLFAFFILQFFGLFHKITYKIVILVIAGAFSLDKSFIVWLIILGVSIITIFFVKTHNLKRLILCSLIFLDLFIFGKPIIDNYIRDLNYLKPSNEIRLSEEFENERLVILDRNGFWNLGLYFKSWGILGYSQYLPRNYVEFINKYGVTNTETLPLETKDLFVDLGVQHVLLPEDSDQISNNMIILSNGEISSQVLSEGDITFKSNTSLTQEVETKVQNYPGWEVYINGVKQNITSASDELFIKFVLPSGINQVKLKFTPKIFYFSLFTSTFLLIFILFLYKKRYVKIIL